MIASRLFCALPALFVLATAAVADEAYKRCIDDSDGTNPAWGACGGAWIAREDAKLNETWKRLYEASGPNTRKDLLEEQRAWNTFKEKSCKFYDNGDFGREGQVLHFPACRAEVIARRTEALKRYEAGP